MEFGPKTQRNLAIIGSVVGIAALSGCDKEYRQAPDNGTIRIEDGKLITPTHAKGKSNVYECDGNVLEISYRNRAASDEDIAYLNDPICADKKITPEDFSK